MVGKKITALALASALVLSPALAIAQEESGEAAGENVINTPFGEVSPVVAGAIAVAAAIGLGIGLSSNNNNNEGTGATGTGGTGAGGTQ
jgi:hypothetical protein